jgi:hypothetical protein
MLLSNKPLRQLSERELEALARYHETQAEECLRHNETRMMADAKECAGRYREELGRRAQ